MDSLNRDPIIWGTGINWGGLNLDPSVIQENSRRIKDRVEFTEGPAINEPVAIVAFGPSLKDTWEKIRDYKIIFSCSGAHKFLLERGIVPTFHVESDPQRHKPSMLGTPHPDVTYLIASIVHPTYFDLLEQHKAKIKLWHLLFMDDSTYKYLPSGEWLLTGGNTVGVRTMKIAYLMRFWNQHIFGLDMSGTHAAKHGKPPTEYVDIEYGGKTYTITRSNMMHWMGLFTDLACCMPNLQYEFFGEGLVQASVKNFKKGDFPLRSNAVMKGDE